MEHNHFLCGLGRKVYNNIQQCVAAESTCAKLLAHPEMLNDIQGLCVIDKCHVLTLCYIYKLVGRYVANHAPSFLDITYEKMQHKTRTNVTFGDYTLSFDSNMYYVEIDCMPWSFVERKHLPEIIIQLTKSSNVLTTHKHVVIIRNIDCLQEAQLNSIKTIIEDVGKDALFLVTAEKRSYIESRFGGLSFLRLPFDKSTFIYNYVLETNPLLVCEVGTILENAQGDLVVAAAMVTAGTTQRNATLSIAKYINQQLQELVGSSGTNNTKLYAKIADLVNIVLSSDVPFTMIFQTVLESPHINPNTVVDVVETLAQANTDLCLSNKPHFVLENMLFEIVQIQRNKMSC